MTTKQACLILEAHGKWRKGADIPPVSTSDLTKAIAVAVKFIKGKK